MWLGDADALLFGRRTYTNFARDWQTQHRGQGRASARRLQTELSYRAFVAVG
jgi:hypothetical protein